MLAYLNGEETALPQPARRSTRFRLDIFLDWCKHSPARIHQVAAAILLQNGVSGKSLSVLRKVPGVTLDRPDDFYRHFDRIFDDEERGHIPNTVLQIITRQWLWVNKKDRAVDPQRLRALAALILFENGFTTEQIASVLGWKAKGSASRAMQSARESIAANVILN